MSGLLELVTGLVERAAAGEAVEAYAVDETERSVTARDGEVESLTSARTRGVGVRVITEQRLGYAWTTELTEAALDEALAAARANATVGTPDPGNLLPDPTPSPLQPPQLWDDAFASARVEDGVALALQLDAAARGRHPDVKGVDGARYGDGATEVAIASTAGVRDSYRRCDAYLMVEVLAERDGATTSAYGLDHGRVPGRLDVDAVAAEGVERAVRLLGGRKPSTARLPVIFDPFTASSLLGLLGSACNGESVEKGRSFLAERVGQRVAPEHVTLVDDGRRQDGPGSSPWDGEGVPTRRSVLIDAGVLRGFLHSTATAARAGAETTGSARRAGFRSPPGVGSANLHLEPGTETAPALLSRAGTAFYCQQVLGLHSGANVATGQFSVGANGLMVRDGQFAEPVREASIASTLDAMLTGLLAVGSDLRFLPFGGGVGVATLLIDEMALGGT